MKRAILTTLLLILGLTGVMSVDAKNYEAQSKETKVWICTGPNARKYHKYYDCRGLQKCSAEIIEVTLTEAQDKGYSRCKLCY